MNQNIQITTTWAGDGKSAATAFYPSISTSYQLISYVIPNPGIPITGETVIIDATALSTVVSAMQTAGISLVILS